MAKTVELETIEKNQTRKLEIMNFLADLDSFDLTIDDIIRSSPRKWQTREKAKRAAQVVVNDSELKEYLYEHGEFYIEKMQEKTNADRRFLIVNQDYIKALVLILASDSILLKEYIRPWGGEAR